jgi:uncharacterized membrane protein YcaP (DUF421 family)
LYISIAIKLIFGLLALLIVTRLLGKKELSQITPFDFIYVLVLGGILEESLYDEKISIWHVLFSIVLWAALIYIIEVLVQKIDQIKPIIKGEPSIIIKDGDLDLKVLNQNHLETEQLRTMLRQQGVFSLKEVKHAILETSGQLSIMKNTDIDPENAGLSYMLIDEGQIKKKALKEINKDEAWLMQQLNKEGFDSIPDIFYAEYSREHGFLIKKYE